MAKKALKHELYPAGNPFQLTLILRISVLGYHLFPAANIKGASVTAQAASTAIWGLLYFLFFFCAHKTMPCRGEEVNSLISGAIKKYSAQYILL